MQSFQLSLKKSTHYFDVCLGTIGSKKLLAVVLWRRLAAPRGVQSTIDGFSQSLNSPTALNVPRERHATFL